MRGAYENILAIVGGLCKNGYRWGSLENFWKKIQKKCMSDDTYKKRGNIVVVWALWWSRYKLDLIRELASPHRFGTPPPIVHASSLNYIKNRADWAWSLWTTSSLVAFNEKHRMTFMMHMLVPVGKQDAWHNETNQQSNIPQWWKSTLNMMISIQETPLGERDEY